jgi:small subunit ribosomal protein S1
MTPEDTNDGAGHDAPGDPPAAVQEPAPAEAPATAQEAQAADGAPQGDAAPTAEGEQKKKRRRRRRRKKKPAEGQQTAAGEATPSSAGRETGEGGEGASDEDDDDEHDHEHDQADGAARPSQAGKKKDRPKKKGGGKPLERPAFNVGDEVFGRVSRVTQEAIFVDVAGGKAVGLYDRANLHQVPPHVGEQFIAKVKSFSMRGGMLMLGPEPWDLAQTRLELRAALETQNPIDCWVTGIVRGGVEVDYNGVRAFAPASHVELTPGGDLTPLLGEKMPFVVSHYGKKGRDVVLSRKNMLEKEYVEKRGVELAKLQPDMVVKGVVRNVVQWGAFVSLPEYGDIEGVVHMSEVSHDRGQPIREALPPGETVDVKILRIDEKGKLWLSRKATVEDPWAHVREKYAQGTIHTGKVARLTDFGAFIQLEPGVDGLLHVADLSFEPIEHPNKVLTEGQDLEVIVANVDSDKHKVALHLAPPEAERGVARPKVAVNAMLKVVVKQIRDAGLGVRIVGVTGRSSRGFIPAGQTGTPRGTDLRKTFPLGTELEAKVIEYDPRRGEARLSIRALKDDEEKRAYREYRKKVQREATFGTFGDLLKRKLEQ